MENQESSAHSDDLMRLFDNDDDISSVGDSITNDETRKGPESTSSINSDPPHQEFLSTCNKMEGRQQHRSET